MSEKKALSVFLFKIKLGKKKWALGCSKCIFMF